MLGYCPSGACQPYPDAVEQAAVFNPSGQWVAFGVTPFLETIDPRVAYESIRLTRLRNSCDA